MKVGELRIGNWIWRPCCNDQVVEILETGIIGLDKLRGLMSFEELKPIPLTHELLLQCGFDEPCDGVYEHDEYNIELTHDYDNKWWVSWNGGEDFWFSIENLHQLQNACQVITGNELNIKCEL